MGRFADQTVVVTGGSRGLGRAIAVAFGAEGAFVYVGFRVREDAARETVAEVEAAGGTGSVLACDVRRREPIDEALRRVLEERGSVDVWVNNAGIVSDAPFCFMEPDALMNVIQVNLVGTMQCCQAVAAPMMAKRAGAIVNIGSVAGLCASPGQANYAAAKGGLVALTKTIAAELAPRGVRVNTVLPGLLETGMAARLDHGIKEAQRKRIPLGRLGTAEEAARAVLFVASAEASYLVGHTLVVDGGMTL